MIMLQLMVIRWIYKHVARLRTPYFIHCQFIQVPFLPLDLSGVLLIVGVLISSHTLLGDIC